MGGASSAVVQQKINQLQQQSAAQVQAQYSQVLQNIVSNAIAELSGGNSTLGSIANMQMTQSTQAQQAAAQSAQLALLLNTGK